MKVLISEAINALIIAFYLAANTESESNLWDAQFLRVIVGGFFVFPRTRHDVPRATGDVVVQVDFLVALVPAQHHLYRTLVEWVEHGANRNQNTTAKNKDN